MYSTWKMPFEDGIAKKEKENWKEKEKKGRFKKEKGGRKRIYIFSLVNMSINYPLLE